MFNNHTYATYKEDIKTPDEWREFILNGKNKLSRTIASNTKVRLTNGGQDIAIKLHDTDIVTVNGKGEYTLNSGGWQTVTTKERINRYTPAGISQRKGIWYMSDGSLFYDGIVIDLNGKPLKPRKTIMYEKRLAKIKKESKQYAKDFGEALEAGKVPMPSSGDCWGCLFASKDHGQPMGIDHLKQHIKEKYYVPSLLVNAARTYGYQDQQIGLMGIGGQKVYMNPERIIYNYLVANLQRSLQ